MSRKPLPREKSTEELTAEREWVRRYNLYVGTVGVEVRRFFDKRTTTIILERYSQTIASKVELMNRGKVVSVSYFLPTLAQALQG